MIKETHIKRQCSVIGSEVSLAAFYYEDARTELKTPLRIEGCDCSHQCKVSRASTLEWSRCPYFGKQA